MTSTPRTPDTEAGKELLDEVEHIAGNGSVYWPSHSAAHLAERLRAIEAQAAEKAESQLAAVDAALDWKSGWYRPEPEWHAIGRVDCVEVIRKRLDEAESRNAVLRSALERIVRVCPDYVEREDALAVLNSPDSAAKEWEARVEVKAVARALVRMKQLGILVDKVRQPEVTARALLDHTGGGES